MGTRLKSIIASYFILSLDALGLFRIAFGLSQLCDLVRRWPSIELLYSNSGVLSNHFVLYAPPNEFLFSPLLLCSTPGEVRAYFCVLACCLLCFIAGYRTKTFHVLCLIGMLGLHNRNILVEYGGDVVANIFWILTLLLPLGKRCSIDALSHSEKSASQYHRSVACALCILQIAAIYFLNAVNKTGQTWADGSAIYYTLNASRMVSPLGQWLLDNIPYDFLKYLTWSVIPLELSIAALIICPVWRKKCRALAVAVLWCLHFGMLLCYDLGVFSIVMMSCSLLLLDGSIHGRVATALQSILALVARPFGARSQTAILATPTFAMYLREGAACFMGLLILTQLVGDNKILSNAYTPQPALLRPFIHYPRIYQGWSMFAPEASKEDGRLVMDLTLASGEHFDPQTGQEPNFATLRDDRIRWTQGWDSYSLRISFDRFQVYRVELERWIRERGAGLYPFVPGSVTRYQVWWLSAQIPPPGASQSSPLHKRLLLEATLR